MQFTDMKAIRALFFIKNPNHQFLFRSRSRQFPSTSNLRFFSHSDSDSAVNPQTTPQVWSFYNPFTSSIETQRTNNKNDQESVPPNLSNDKIRVSSDDNSSKMGLASFSGENEGNGASYSLKKADIVNETASSTVISRRKKGKSKVTFVCNNCGHEEGQFWGRCRNCREYGSLKEFTEAVKPNNGKVSGAEISENLVKSWLPQTGSGMRPMKLKDVSQGMNPSNWRIPLPGLFGGEVARVLGGGIVPGSLILIGGDPGVGKSTMLLQIAALVADNENVDKQDPVVYVSGEESVEQIVNRADRLSINVEELYLYSGTNIEDIFVKIQPLSPSALIVDSIQTIYIEGAGSAGGISQIKECTSALLRFAKKTNIPVFLIGHVTKSGEIAGPRVLEHIVDVVLYLEGEKHSSHRLLRPVKNRFGSTDELGVFEMSLAGLQTVANPSEIFLSEQFLGSEVLVGLAVAVIMDGSRSFLIEIQALCATGSSVSRHANGIQANRADMIISVLRKQAGLMLQDSDIFLNVISGMTLTETAGDLAIAVAICSSFLEFPIPNNVAFIGEIGLGGELRMVPRIEKRVHTVAKLGYKMCIVPKLAKKNLLDSDFEGLQIIGCDNLKQVIDVIFTKHG